MRSKLSNYFFFLFAFSFLLLQNSCSNYKDVQIKKVIGAYPTNVSAEGLEVDVAIKIHNPNNYNITIVKSDLGLSLSNRKVGSTKLVKKVKLKKNSEEVYRFSLKGNFDKSGDGPGINEIYRIVTERSMPLRAEGTIKARAYWLVSKKIPVDFSERVKL